MKVLLISHGGMAEGMKETVQMVFGTLPNLEAMGLKDGEGVNQFEQRLSDFLDSIRDEYLIVLSDIKGGSPYTTCANLLMKKGRFERTQLISGMNLPLLLGICMNQQEPTQEEWRNIIHNSRESIAFFELLEDDDEDL